MSKFISTSNLRKLADALQARYKELVVDEKERAMEAENNLQAKVDITQNMLGGKSIVYMTQNEFDSLTEAEKNDNSKTYFITDAVDLSHEHENKDFLDNLEARNITIGNSTKVFDGARDISYSLDEIGVASKEHNHDDKYYTETEIDGIIENVNDSLNTAIVNSKNDAINASKSYTDTAITKLVDSAPEAMNTLNELANAIKDHQDEYEAYISTVAANIATAKSEAIAEAAKKDTALHTTISAEIDADVADEKERAMEVESALQAEVELTKNMLDGRSIKYVTQAEYDALSEAEKNDVTKAYFVTGVADTSHTHENKDFLDNLAARNITIGNSTKVFDGANNLSYSLNEIGAASKEHNHDDRYYTETEIDGKIEDINDNIDGKVAALNTSINGKAPSNHNHDDKYYTETEIDGKISTLNTAIDGKSDSGHNHDDRYYTETEMNTKLADINETINNKEATLQAGIQNLTNNKADISYVNGKLSVVDAIKLNGYSLWVGTSSELDAITTKDPNTLYFEIDDGTGEEVVQVNVTNGVLQLTTDKYQKTNMLDGTTIVFPAVNRFTEIHLYFNAGINMNLNFPDCKWRVDPNIEEGNSYELIATYNTMDWLVNLVVYS